LSRSQFANEVYDPNEIYTGPATDKEGHSSNMRCAIPTPWAGAVSEVVNSPEWPEIKSSQDFIRDAIYHRLHWTSEQKNRGNLRYVSNLQALSEASAILARHREFQSAYELFDEESEESLRQALLTNDADILMSLIEDLSTSVPRFPEPYRTSLSNKLDQWKRRA
jgi:hypothetical protein